MRTVHPDMQPLQQLERRLCDCQIELHASGITLRDAVGRKASEHPRSHSVQFRDARIATPADLPSQSTQRLRLTWADVGLDEVPSASRSGGDYRVGGSSSTREISQFQFEFQARAGAWGNVLFLFDYQSPEDFKYVGCRIGANYWTVGEYREGAFRDLTRMPEDIPPETRHVLDIVLDDSTISLYANGVHKVTHDFMRSVAGRRIGVSCGSEKLMIGGVRSLVWQPVTPSNPAQHSAKRDSAQPVAAPALDAVETPVAKPALDAAETIDEAATSAAIALKSSVVATEIWGEEESPAKVAFEMREIKQHPTRLRKAKTTKAPHNDFELFTD